MKMKIWNKPRVFIQLFIIGIVIYSVFTASDPEAYCPMGGILSIGSRFINGASSCQMGENQMFMGIGLLVAILIIGKLFCSYICPIGTVTEWLGRMARKFKLQIQELPKILDRSLRVLKYALLFPVLYYTVNSSELFCKKFDPYFAITTGFHMDVEVLWAIAAIVVTIVGSFFIRQFWCKYLCPLGALSNIFMNLYIGAGALIVYIAIRWFGIELDIMWLFLVWLVAGFAVELLSKNAAVVPLLKIHRNSDSCTNCSMCDKACPYGIPVSTMDKVKDVDCTMCADCVDSCPVPDTLTIQKKNAKWLPAVATVLIIVSSMIIASRYELATISEKWGLEGKDISLSQYEQVIQTVKCYGTSVGVMRNLKGKPGIYGVDTYSRSHKVVVHYNPEETNELGIKKALFSPSKTRIRTFKKGTPESITVGYFGVQEIKDLIDKNNMIRILRKSPHVYGMQTYFGEPTRTLVYYDAANVTPQEISDLIEIDEITYKLRNGDSVTKSLDFKVRGETRTLAELETLVYSQVIFKSFDRKRSKYKDQNEDSLQICKIKMIDAENFLKTRYLPHLFSHLSANDGLMRMETVYWDDTYALIYFDPAQINAGQIETALSSEMLTVTYSSGEKKDMKNPFEFAGPSELISIESASLKKAEIHQKFTFLDEFQK